MKPEEIEELKRNLEGFSGTEKYHHVTLVPIKCTDGVAYLAEKAKCYWLIDAIASYQLEHKNTAFQLWEIRKVGTGAVLTMREDSHEPARVKQEFTYTDFPLNEVKFYLCDGVLMLPGEY